MKVSICIVTRNRSDSLRRAISSILASSAHDTYDDFEILMIDNSDPDEYLLNGTLCHLDSRIRQITSNSKVGIASLRQIGIEESRGEVVAFIDDDIEVPEKWIAAMVDAFKSDEHLGIYGCSVKNIGFDDKVVGYETRGFPKKHGTNGSLKPSVSEGEIVTFGESNLALRREYALKAGGFDKRFKWGYEGADLTQRMLAQGCTICYNQKITIKHYFNEYRSKSKFDKVEFYRLLFYFKYFGIRQFSIVYEIKRIFYFAVRKNYYRALFISFLFLLIPLVILEAKKSPR